MNIVVAGASGLIGKALVESLIASDHNVKTLVRRKPLNDSEIFWEPQSGVIESDKLIDVDTVINLGGENIASGRWTKSKKKRILDSRVKSTTLLCETLVKLDKLPSTLLSASADGYYGDCNQNEVTEASPPGDSFIADVCRQWEEATNVCKEAGIRVVNCRFGIVLTPQGGALKKMLPAFKFGVGGKLGSGKQMMNWISMHDCIRAMLYLIENENIKNAVNIIAPEAITNKEFTKAIAKYLKRPALFPVPSFVIKILLGELGSELLKERCKIIPEKLINSGFQFKYPDINSALNEILK
ncbi:MAG: TIGR01777 family oxidoreductase [bacterium]